MIHLVGVHFSGKLWMCCTPYNLCWR